MDELADRTTTRRRTARTFDLGMRAFVNGVQVSHGNVKDMTWTFAQILERASYGVTLYPGDVIGSGTCRHRLLPRAERLEDHEGPVAEARATSWPSRSTASARLENTVVADEA